ncbi:SDR family oxidoreductase [Sphingobium phenoxybenzoativorans]|uniref:SDR family oxidoreductase n=1 Tax=Sphingobium phenoxybenzoativorans TaxID=1592790 RepID=UPI0008720504|nr:SDR family oxidoreductase [Sphingobium phenoxybenzoativorans]
MDLGLRSRTALVCGGSRGIGLAIVEELTNAGCRVAILARDQARLDELVIDLRHRGHEAVGIAGDLADLEFYRHASDMATATLGPPTIAIFNGLSPRSGDFDAMTIADFAEAHHQVVGCFAAMVKAVLPGMKAEGWGRIVTIGSNVAKQPFRGDRDAAYVLANTERVAAVGLSKTLSAELAPFGITVNTILTGAIDTGSARAWCAQQAAEAGISTTQFVDRFVNDRIPMRRMGTPDEMAALCAFLCSARAGYTTGETILCDGGVSMAMI